MAEAEPRTITRTDWLLIAALVALVLPLRLWLLHNTEVTARDSIGYIRYALQFESTPWRNVLNNNHQHPGYPILILLMSQPIRAFEGATTPENMELSAQLVSFFASLLLLLPMYFLGRQFFDRTISFGGALLYQYLPISAHHLSDGISEPVFLLFLVSGLLQAIHAVRDRDIRRCALAGLFTGLAYLTRPEGLLILPPFGLVLIALQIRSDSRVSWPRFLTCGASALAATALVGATYVYAVGHITNKPSAKATMNLAADARAAPVFAASFSPGETGAIRLARSAQALISEVSQGLHYAGIVPAILGLCWSFALLRGHPAYWLSAAFVCLHGGILVMLAMSVAYVSDRHVMILVVFGAFLAVFGLRELPRRVLAWCNREGSIGDRARLRSEPVWFAILFVMFFAICLPKAIERLHGNRAGNHAAGLWLQHRLEPGDIVDDDHSWSHFIAGQVFIEGQEPALPADRRPTCYVVTTRSNDPHIDASRTARLADDARLVYAWPEGVEAAKARVVVHAQARNPQTHPWRVAR